ncbi:MAG: hypothetical protein ABI437_11255 [Kofleriaceae bacterium]
MEIVLVACVATLAVCAVLARPVRRPPATPVIDASSAKFDRALMHLIREVTHEPAPRRSAYVHSDGVMVGSRIRALDDRPTSP